MSSSDTSPERHHGDRRALLIGSRSLSNAFSLHTACLLAWLLNCILLHTLSAKIPASTYDAICAELQRPVQLHLRNGGQISGHSIEVSQDQIQVASAQGAGEIRYTFDPSQIQAYTLPGDSYKTLAIEWMHSGQTADALELMHLLYLQRLQLLPFLAPAESHFFVYYVDLSLAAGMPERAIAIANKLKPQIKHPAALRALNDALLKSYNRLQLYDVARPLAQAWVAQRAPHGDSALGYYMLGAEQLRREDYQAALELALQPIVFSSPAAVDKLAHCYAIAISAALALRDKDYALTLHSDMQQRGLHWPSEDPNFSTAFKQLCRHLRKTTACPKPAKPTDPKAH